MKLLLICFDNLFFLHSSLVSPSSLGEGLRNVFISRGRNTGIHYHLEVTSIEESSKEKFSYFKILSFDLRDIFFHSTIVY